MTLHASVCRGCNVPAQKVGIEVHPAYAWCCRVVCWAMMTRDYIASMILARAAFNRAVTVSNLACELRLWVVTIVVKAFIDLVGLPFRRTRQIIIAHRLPHCSLLLV